VILVDTSVLIDFFCGKRILSCQKFEDILLKHIPFGITSIIIQEVLQGARTANEFNKLKLYLENQVIYSPSHKTDTFINAAKIYFDLRKMGLTVRSTIDCLIAQISIEHDLYLLHNDKDFLTIAKSAPLKFF
jgi:predicted nucleic acid-binding protein